jgi:hypothetical protein
MREKEPEHGFEHPDTGENMQAELAIENVFD